MAEAEDALYVAFMGTKQRRDLVANAQVMQDPVWPEEAAAAGGQDAQVVTLSPLQYSRGLLGLHGMSKNAASQCGLQVASMEQGAWA